MCRHRNALTSVKCRTMQCISSSTVFLYILLSNVENFPTYTFLSHINVHFPPKFPFWPSKCTTSIKMYGLCVQSEMCSIYTIAVYFFAILGITIKLYLSTSALLIQTKCAIWIIWNQSPFNIFLHLREGMCGVFVPEEGNAKRNFDTPLRAPQRPSPSPLAFSNFLGILEFGLFVWNR